jgi:hypothetical protein
MLLAAERFLIITEVQRFLPCFHYEEVRNIISKIQQTVAYFKSLATPSHRKYKRNKELPLNDYSLKQYPRLYI